MLFESPPLSLSELLDDIHAGKIQLPDFQRPWKWDDERIISLLASRPLSGADVPPGTEPAELLMDGQQRMTSLYQALRSGGPVDTMDSRGKPITRWYYLDIEGALNPLASREDVILSAAHWLSVARSQDESLAFAAELLAPAEGIRLALEVIGKDDDSALESVARRFRVCPLLVRHQYDNQLAEPFGRSAWRSASWLHSISRC